jgi:SAM-dependent methyltransferase
VRETEYFTGLIKARCGTGERTLLHLGCGGGHNDRTFKSHFNLTGVDISREMLQLAAELNPEVTYIQGDMRTLRLPSTFDAVAILDSVNCMLSAADLRAAFETAWVHLRPGGIFLTIVEEVRETFRQNRTWHWTHRRGDVEITFIENSYDPDPTDTTYESTFVFLIRERGDLRIETDRHLGGLFDMGVWYASLRAVGFKVETTSMKGDEVRDESTPVLLCARVTGNDQCRSTRGRDTTRGRDR